jgi:hypothetical protein
MDANVRLEGKFQDKVRLCWWRWKIFFEKKIGKGWRGYRNLDEYNVYEKLKKTQNIYNWAWRTYIMGVRGFVTYEHQYLFMIIITFEVHKGIMIMHVEWKTIWLVGAN